MKIILNGQEKRLEAPVTVAALLEEMGLGERRVAVEVNREIVPRSRHGEFQLLDNDHVEVVFAIGGGGMSREQDARRGQSRGPTTAGMRPRGGMECAMFIAVVIVASAARSRFAGPSGYAPVRTHEVGMRPVANAVGHRQHGLSAFKKVFGGIAHGGNR